MVNKDNEFVARFYARTNKKGDCWEWAGALFKSTGYGCSSYQGKTQSAHRISYKITKGDIPEKMFVMHTCDNKRCVNPKHLKLGTYRDNIDDMVSKKRSLLGIKNPANKLTEEQVREIRKKYIPRKMSIYKLAKEYGVVSNCIYQIIKYKKWKHI